MLRVTFVSRDLMVQSRVRTALRDVELRLEAHAPERFEDGASLILVDASRARDFAGARDDVLRTVRAAGGSTPRPQVWVLARHDDAETREAAAAAGANRVLPMSVLGGRLAAVVARHFDGHADPTQMRADTGALKN